MLIVAFDPSLTSTGYAGPEGVLNIRPGGEDEPRLVTIRDEVLHLADGASLVVMEGLAFQARGSAVTGLAGLHWVLRVAFHERGQQVAVVPASVAKRYATGKGNASKDQVVAAVASRFGDRFDGVFTPSRPGLTDRVDAWVLRQCAVAHYLPHLVDIVMPESHRKGLASSVPWPEPPG